MSINNYLLTYYWTTHFPLFNLPTRILQNDMQTAQTLLKLLFYSFKSWPKCSLWGACHTWCQDWRKLMRVSSHYPPAVVALLWYPCYVRSLWLGLYWKGNRYFPYLPIFIFDQLIFIFSFWPLKCSFSFFSNVGSFLYKF